MRFYFSWWSLNRLVFDLSSSQLCSHNALSFAASMGFVNVLKWRPRLLVTCLSCMCCKPVWAHMHTHAGIYELQWKEESREDRARHPVPSPIFITCYTSPFPHTFSPPPPLLAKVGVCKLGVCHITSTALAHVVWRYVWGSKASQQFYSQGCGPQKLLFHFKETMTVKRAIFESRVLWGN